MLPAWPWLAARHVLLGGPVVMMAAVPVPTTDWYASWCQGCREVYPTLCKVAQDKELRRNFLFLKARSTTCHVHP